MDREADANQILFEPPLELWRRPPGRPHSTWLRNFIITHQTLQGHLTNTEQSCVNSDTDQVLASSPKDVLKSTVFSCRRKAASDCSSLTKDGKEFRYGQLQLETQGHPGEYADGTDRQTHGRQTITLCFPLDAASITKHSRKQCFESNHCPHFIPFDMCYQTLEGHYHLYAN